MPAVLYGLMIIVKSLVVIVVLVMAKAPGCTNKYSLTCTVFVHKYQALQVRMALFSGPMYHDKHEGANIHPRWQKL